MTKKMGGPQKLAIHPRLANPFLAKQKTDIIKQSYTIQSKQILNASLNLDKLTRPNIHFLNEKKKVETKKITMGMSTHYGSRFMLKKAEENDDYLEYESMPDEKSMNTPDSRQWVEYKKDKQFRISPDKQIKLGNISQNMTRRLDITEFV